MIALGMEGTAQVAMRVGVLLSVLLVISLCPVRAPSPDPLARLRFARNVDANRAGRLAAEEGCGMVSRRAIFLLASTARAPPNASAVPAVRSMCCQRLD